MILRIFFVFAIFIFSANTAFAGLSVNFSELKKAISGNNGQHVDFVHAKRILRNLYKRHQEWRTTIYCNAHFSDTFKIFLPLGFESPEQLSERSLRIEWEHAVPAENFGRHFKEWREGDPNCQGKRGRACARINPVFSKMEGDMHNLFPSIGSVNAARSNYRYAMLDSGTQPFGSCPVVIRERAFMPPEHARGTVARASLYMADYYKDAVPHLFSDSQMKLFTAWDKMYPPNISECERNRAIEQAQGNDNPYITKACK